MVRLCWNQQPLGCRILCLCSLRRAVDKTLPKLYRPPGTPLWLYPGATSRTHLHPPPHWRVAYEGPIEGRVAAGVLVQPIEQTQSLTNQLREDRSADLHERGLVLGWNPNLQPHGLDGMVAAGS